MKYKHRHKEEQKAKARGHLIANKLFKDYYYDGNFLEFCRNLQLFAGVIAKQDEYVREFWDDGELIESYYEYDLNDTPSVEGNLRYISDRFNCQGRLKWLLELNEFHNNP